MYEAQKDKDDEFIPAVNFEREQSKRDSAYIKPADRNRRKTKTTGKKESRESR